MRTSDDERDMSDNSKTGFDSKQLEIITKITRNYKVCKC